MIQTEILELLKMGNNCFVTGPAGSGKTHLLRDYIKWLNKNNISVAVTASTGIAATHLSGQTIHSWSGLGARDYLSPYELEALSEKKYLHDRFKKTKVLIIDEISMLSADSLDAIESICRLMKNSSEPFGGLQVVFSGDFFQLPPIGRGATRFAYGARAWRLADIKVCLLDSQWRQTDKSLYGILQAIRTKTLTIEHRKELETRLKGKINFEIHPVRLFTHNVDVDSSNSEELNRLDGPVKRFESIHLGNKKMAQALERGSLIQPNLQLKVGARVMFIKNDFEKNIANGTLGQVVDFSSRNEPVVLLADKRELVVASATWTIEEDGKVKAQVSQMPLRLAWAITVHKSQGMTLEAAEIDLSKAFGPGMGYVALSRIKSLTGLKLLGLSEQAYFISEDAYVFEERARAESYNLSEALKLMTAETKTKTKDKFLAVFAEAPTKKALPSHDETAVLLKDGLTLKDVADKRGVKVETIITHLEKLKSLGTLPDIIHFKPAENRLNVIKKVLAEDKTGKLSPLKSKLPRDFSFAEIRLAKIFLEE